MLDATSNAPSPTPSRPAVLLLEAEPMLRRTMTKYLQRSGCRVTACADGADGAAALAEAQVPPALIVLGARVLDAQLAEVAWQLYDLAPGAPMLGIADAVGYGAADTAPLPPGLRFLAPPFDFPDVLRAVRSSLRHAGFRLPDTEALEA